MTMPLVSARSSFQVKVLVPVILVLVLLTAVTMLLVNRRIDDQMRQNAAEHLETAGKIFQKIRASHSSDLLSRYNSIINEPRYKAVTRNSDLPALKSFIGDLVTETVKTDHGAAIATFTLLAETNESVISATDDSQIKTSDFQAKALSAIRLAARESVPRTDTIRVGSNLLDIVSFPVGLGGRTAGVLTYGVLIGPRESADIKEYARSKIIFLTGGRLATSSLKQPELSSLMAKAFVEHPAKPDGNTPTRLILDGEHYLCQPGHFTSLSGDTTIGYLLLSSEEKSLADFRLTQRTLLAVGLLGILLSSLLIGIVIQKITRPLRELRASAEAVGRGDFSREVEVNSQDECGVLAITFNQMTRDVKTSRDELEKTVATLKATQNQLIQSEKLSGIGEFVAGVAHELNNPLTSVMGFSELLQQSELPEQQRRYLDVIFKSSKRCQKIVQSLLSFARRHAPERKVVCVNEILESAVEILQYQMRTNNIEVLTQFDPRLPVTEVDPHQMQQVFLNIINNARQAMEGHQAKGCVRITTESSDGYVRIIFKDNGPGIPPENLKRIFNPFFTTKEVGKGTGLGLSLCYGIVGEHGGTITPFSKPGEGATFTIELPVTQTAAAPVEKPAAIAAKEAAQDGVGKRVLVIDDEDLILQMIREVLTRNGYKVDIAHDGEAALRRLGQYHYDLALCDWKMPGLNGQQVYEKLQSNNPDMSRRMIFITGDVVNEKVQDFLRSEKKVCLSKPFTLVEFRSAINQVIATN